MRSQIRLVTEDDVQIHANLTHALSSGEKQSCMIVVPGFAQNSQTAVFSQISDHLAKYADVLCIDPRGTGSSEGGYYFGTHEYLDVIAAVQWAKTHYSDFYLLGFSLGAYSALRAAVSMEHRLRHLFLVSCPTSVDEIFWSGAAIRHFLSLIPRRGAWGKDRDLFFRWRYPFGKKPSAEDLASRLQTPVSFLVGGRDLLTPKCMSQRVYQQVRKAQKNWLELPEGDHAEELFLSPSKEVENWLLAGMMKG
jgi:pimeloyl-ACP methyl ester carboxylesterase